MRIIDGLLVLETTHCSNCTAGKQPGSKPCSACKGTGNGKRGGRGGCQSCYGSGKQYSWDDPITCPVCKGTDSRPEDDTDLISDSDLRAIPVRVVRENRGSTWNEEYLGMGSLFGCIDYGQAWRNADEELITRMYDSAKYVQACKVTRDGRVCDFLVIVCHRQGYTVQASFLP